MQRSSSVHVQCLVANKLMHALEEKPLQGLAITVITTLRHQVMTEKQG